MGRFIDLSGKTYGNLKVIKRIGTAKNGDSIWRCQCKCGNYHDVNASSLKSGNTKSCGCMAKEWRIAPHLKHGKSKTRLYHVWHGMIQRCNNSEHKEFCNYGGRGITVCREWQGEKGFEAFEKWANENGFDENAERSVCTLDRVNVNGNYEPNNCRWVDMKAQSNNKRTNFLIEFNREKHTLSEWSRITGISRYAIKRRIKAGWSIEDSLSVVDGRRKHG